MRNLAEHPVTAEEKLRALQWAYEQAVASAGQRGFGDTTCAALLALVRTAEAAAEPAADEPKTTMYRHLAVRVSPEATEAQYRQMMAALWSNRCVTQVGYLITDRGGLREMGMSFGANGVVTAVQG
jgi:alkanesulfonate monooxygenase SsuD/methylene tetrahydromethanopterin reductase-like flavin-dependent oxidoreductase (luciferase family)